jgi:crossover junction endodeoxyribonuclease RuvC
MLVLGLDPGLATTGFGLVGGDDQGLELVEYGVIRTEAGVALAERLVLLHDAIAELVARSAPDVAAVEELFFSTNARTAMLVGEARGVLLLTLAQAGLPIYEYKPMQVKQAITGYGSADKNQIQQMVRLLLNLDAAPEPDDAADALAVSICHHHSARVVALLNQ